MSPASQVYPWGSDQWVPQGRSECEPAGSWNCIRRWIAWDLGTDCKRPQLQRCYKELQRSTVLVVLKNLWSLPIQTGCSNWNISIEDTTAYRLWRKNNESQVRGYIEDNGPANWRYVYRVHSIAMGTSDIAEHHALGSPTWQPKLGLVMLRKSLARAWFIRTGGNPTYKRQRNR